VAIALLAQLHGTNAGTMFYRPHKQNAP